MKVTDKNLYMEPKLKFKLDLMIKRMTGRGHRDNLVLIDGDEGDGKSNMAALIAYYVSYETKRKLILSKNLYFNLDNLIDYASRTEGEIIVWDEGALGGLALEWWKKNQLKFLKLLMVARKKRHFFVICIPKFFRLSEYLAVDRSIALIHVYSSDGLNMGRFVYYNKKNKEKLYEKYRKTRSKEYKRLYNFRGRFLETLKYVFDEEQYNKMKDEAILSIGEDTTTNPVQMKKEMTISWMKNMVQLKENGLKVTNKQIAKVFDCSERTIDRLNKEIKQIPRDSNRQTDTRRLYNKGYTNRNEISLVNAPTISQ